MAKTRILICGATGFIGRNAVEYFSANPNNEITAVWHKRPSYEVPTNVTWVQGDLRNPDDVERLVKGQDVIVQAAATTSGSKEIVSMPYIHVTDNAVMNSYLLRAAYEESTPHFVFFSCSVMYPSSRQPVSEGDFSGTLTDKYFGVGWTKVYIERMCEFYAGLGRTKHTVIRHSNIYGPYDKFDLERSHVCGASVTKAMLADTTFNVWGTGEEKRDLLYVDDLMSFIDAAIERQQAAFGLYNCGSGQAHSVKRLVEHIISATGKKLELEHDLSKPTIPFSLSLNCEKAADELGWRPQVDLEEGIKRTVEWWQQNIDPSTLSLRE